MIHIHAVLYQKQIKELLQEFDAKQTMDALELPHNANFQFDLEDPAPS